jgi:hypothetical protein
MIALVFPGILSAAETDQGMPRPERDFRGLFQCLPRGKALSVHEGMTSWLPSSPTSRSSKGLPALRPALFSLFDNTKRAAIEWISILANDMRLTIVSH